jgi:hypothetical protein
MELSLTHYGAGKQQSAYRPTYRRTNLLGLRVEIVELASAIMDVAINEAVLTMGNGEWRLLLTEGSFPLLKGITWRMEMAISSMELAISAWGKMEIGDWFKQNRAFHY